MTNRALIIGVTGQDGAYLSKHLLERGYEVHGSSRDAEMARVEGLAALDLRDSVNIHSVSPVDFHSVVSVINAIEPDEIYNLSGQSSVGLSFSQPAETLESHAMATLNLLEAVRLVSPQIKLYNAGSSECFGDTGMLPANENTAFRPSSPYGVAKTAAVQLVSNYRESYGLFVCSGILFNHESPLRPSRFVTRKITSAAARIANGSAERLTLGDISIQRDWGWAPDAVDAMWRMMQIDSAEDFVIATGQTHALQDFVALAFEAVGLDWEKYVDIDQLLKRPSEIRHSVGDASKAHKVLGWAPTIGFENIVERLMDAELERLRS